MIIKRKWNEVTLRNVAFGKLWKSYKNNLMKNGKRLSLTNLYFEQVLQVVLERNILKICPCLK